MKKLSIVIFLAVLISTFISCKKEIMGYKGKEGVYFAVRHGNPLLSSWPYQPFSNVEFVRINKEEVDFQVKVMITGPVKDYDRTFKLEVNPDSTTAVAGQHYEPFQENWTIPAGQVSTNVTVHLKRTPDLETVERTLGLRLVATPQLALSFPEWDALPELTAGIVVPEFDASLHTLRINDIMVEPEVWLGSLQSGNRESGTMGVFTRRKMEFLSEYLGLTYEDFSSEESMPLARTNLIGKDAAAILIARYDAGNPVLEDDGRLMFIGSVPWTSILGVPYVPSN